MIGCSSARLRLQTDASDLTALSDAFMYTATLPRFPRYDVHYGYKSCSQLLIQRKEQSLVRPPICRPVESRPSRSVFARTGKIDNLQIQSSYLVAENSKKLGGAGIYILVKHCGTNSVPPRQTAHPVHQLPNSLELECFSHTR